MARRGEHRRLYLARAPQRTRKCQLVARVAYAPAMCAAVVLGVFIAIALLDSVHFRARLPAVEGAAANAQVAYATRTTSIFDRLMSHAIEAREKTYSVPLAYWSFQKETQVIDGKEMRSNPRLAFGGAHLKNPESEWTADMCARSFSGVLFGLLMGIAIASAAAALLAGDMEVCAMRYCRLLAVERKSHGGQC